MDYPLEVTDQDLNELKSQIEAQRKKQEYDKLKKDLFDLSFKAQHTLTEFEGSMKEVDTHQILKNKRTTHTFYELLINRIIKMCNPRPIVGNLIAIGLSCIGLVFLLNFLNDPDLKSLKIGLGYFIEMAAAIQILKSATRSLVLPLTATLIGALVSNQLTGHHLFLNHNADFFLAMMSVGIVGIAISVFSID